MSCIRRHCGAASVDRATWLSARRIAAAVLLAAASATAAASAAEQIAWEQSPYHIVLTLAVDSSARPGLVDEAMLAKEIAERVEAAVGPLWRLEIDVVQGQRRRDLCADLGQPTWDALPVAARSADKAMWLSVQCGAAGFVIRCREYDIYVRRAGAVLEQTVRQPRMLGEACFSLLRRTFAPLAIITPVPDDDEYVQLNFKGSGLPKRSEEALFAEPGVAFLPLIRRTNRSGELLANGVTPLPWTYLTPSLVDEQTNLAKVESGVRRPFSVRRRGLVEQLAIAVPAAAQSTTVRFHSRHNPELSLAGYEVFVRGEEGEPQIVGVTSAEGSIEIPDRYGPVAVLYLRSDGQVLAKAPVAPGAAVLVEIPISDDPSRLLAQARSQIIREQLIDLVARRTILSARVRARLQEGRVDDAQRLMIELNSMPKQREFNMELDAAQRDRQAKSDDQRVQRKIDRIYADMRSLLSRYLSVRPLIELQSEVDAAARDGS